MCRLYVGMYTLHCITRKETFLQLSYACFLTITSPNFLFSKSKSITSNLCDNKQLIVLCFALNEAQHLLCVAKHVRGVLQIGVPDGLLCSLAQCAWYSSPGIELYMHDSPNVIASTHQNDNILKFAFAVLPL